MKHENLLQSRKDFYEKHLTEVILPYWIGKTDKDTGGFYTCYNADGSRLESKDRYVWSQGRCVWMYAKLAGSQTVSLSPDMRERCRENAVKGAGFLKNFCILPSGECAFCIDGSGNPRTVYPQFGFQGSTFADCFTVMGLSAAAGLTRDSAMAEDAWRLFLNIEKRLESGTFQTAPSLLPAGWHSHAVPMITVNTGSELVSVLQSFGMLSEAAHVEKAVERAVLEITEHFMSQEGFVYECLDENYLPLDSVYGRHINPGHTNECMWFLLEVLSGLSMENQIPRAVKTVAYTSRLAWDKTYGGIYYYSDRSGSAPKGGKGPENPALARGLLRDWSNKLWWPHMESIYANLLCYSITGEEDFWDLYEQFHDYTFSTFPNPDKTVGEWIQLRDRTGAPLWEEVGGRLPVKDPYHITRGLILLIGLLDKMQKN